MARAAAPPGFVIERSPGCVRVVDAELREAIATAGLLEPAALQQRLAAGRGATGRAATVRVTLPGRPERLLVRALRRGGALGPLLGGALARPDRPLREIEVTDALRRAGAPVPRPAFALAWRAGPWWNGALATVLEPDAVDGVALLEGALPPARLRAAARAAGRAIRAFHGAGGVHPDLHVKNLLFRPRDAGFEVVIVDLDRARRRAAVPPAERMRELMRLYRSLRKRGLLERVGERACVAAFGAYVAGDRALRRALLARLPRERARLALHAWRYRQA